MPSALAMTWTSIEFWTSERNRSSLRRSSRFWPAQEPRRPREGARRAGRAGARRHRPDDHEHVAPGLVDLALRSAPRPGRSRRRRRHRPARQADRQVHLEEPVWPGRARRRSPRRRRRRSRSRPRRRSPPRGRRRPRTCRPRRAARSDATTVPSGAQTLIRRILPDATSCSSSWSMAMASPLVSFASPPLPIIGSTNPRTTASVEATASSIAAAARWSETFADTATAAPTTSSGT